MFAEYLQNETWQTVMPGVSVCKCGAVSRTGEVPLVLQPRHSEVFYCTGGSLTISRDGGSQIIIGARESLLVSDLSSIRSVLVTAPLEGIFLAVDQAAAGDTFLELCHQFGDLSVSMKQIGENMALSGGFRAVPVSPWSRAAFYAIKKLPKSEQPTYCLLKTFELLYLICTQEQEGSVTDHDVGGNLMTVANNMKAYMEQHMDEKLTITELSRKFHLSRTACKSMFRSCFGQPIHAWLLDRRMEKAAELLEKTKMPILQVAQAVGYTGVSQFNVAFRQRYGKSPREYRKMSVSVAF